MQGIQPEIGGQDCSEIFQNMNEGRLSADLALANISVLLQAGRNTAPALSATILYIENFISDEPFISSPFFISLTELSHDNDASDSISQSIDEEIAESVVNMYLNDEF